MRTPEEYYESMMKFSVPVIRANLRRLREKISDAKGMIERREEIRCDSVACEALNGMIGTYRLYAEQAKRAIRDLGGVYVPTEEEIADGDIAASVGQIRRITVESGGFYDPTQSFALTRTENGDVRVTNGSEWGREPDREIIPVMEFDSVMRGLHLGEWDKAYDETHEMNGYGVMIEDGTAWKMTVEFEDGREPLSYSGIGLYPWNFDLFADMIGLWFRGEEEDTEETEDEEEDEE